MVKVGLVRQGVYKTCFVFIKNMQFIESSYVHEFIFDLEFIYDVKNLSRCRIWEIALYSCKTRKTFHSVIDPNPKMSHFPIQKSMIKGLCNPFQ